MICREKERGVVWAIDAGKKGRWESPPRKGEEDFFPSREGRIMVCLL